MAVVVITPPALLVPVPDAKLWAPVLSDDDDRRVEALLRTVQFSIEPPVGWVGRAFGMQQLEARFDDFDGICRLPCPPVRQIVSVTYIDPDGTERSLDASAYRVAGLGTASASLAPVPGAAWPAVSCRPDAVAVRFQAGYASDDPEVQPVRQAVVLAATQLRSLGTQDLALRTRQIEGVGSRTWTVSDAAEKLVRNAVDSLLAPYRVWA